MRINHAIKKIAAVGTGAMMLGMSAAAVSANLADYPAPFIQNGEFSGSFVVGEAAETIDVLGTIEIATSLQAAATVPVYGDGSEGETVLEDSFRIQSGSNHLLLGSGLNLKPTLTEDDLSMLRDVRIEDNSGSMYDVQFRIGLPNAPIAFGNDVLDRDQDPQFFVDFSGGQPWTFDMTFPDGVNFNDFKGERIHILGEEYVFGQGSDVDHNAGLVTLYRSGVEIVVGDSVETVMLGGEQVTLEVEGGLVGGDEAFVRVNGAPRKVEEGNFYTIGGVRLYVDSVAVFTDDRARVVFFLGADKLTLRNNQEVEHTVGSNDERVRGTLVEFTGDFATGTDVSRIRITYTPNEHRAEFSPVVNRNHEGFALGQEYVDPVFGQVKFAFTDVVPGMTSAAKEHIQLRSNGDRMRLTVSNFNGVEYDLTVLRADDRTTNTDFRWAYDYALDREQRIYVFGERTAGIYTGGTALFEDNRFIVRENPESEFTRFVEVTDIDVDDDTSTIRLLDLGTGNDREWQTLSGETYEWDGAEFVDYTGGDEYHYGTYSYDGVDYAFLVNSDAATPYVVLAEWVSGDLVPRAADNRFVTRNGAVLWFLGADQTNAAFGLQEESEFNNDNPRDNPLEHGVLAISFTYDGDDLKTATPVVYLDDTPADGGALWAAGWSDQQRLESNDDVTHAITIYGTTVAQNTDRGDIDIYYPRQRVVYNVFVGPVSAGTSVGGSESSVVGEQINPINVGTAILDREAAGLVGTSNLLVVGGPCVNTVAAQLMGNPADCTAGFTQGSAMIKVYPNAGGTVSLLVAGYTGADTRLASRVLANYKQHEGRLVGNEVVVSGTTLANVDISAPSATVDDN